MPARKNIDDALAAKLAAGFTYKAAADALGIDERTARRRAARPEFRRFVAAMRRELLAGAVGRLADRMNAAADVLGKLLESPNEAIRLKAAVALLDHGLKAVVMTELEERIDIIESRLAHANTAATLEQDRSPTS